MMLNRQILSIVLFFFVVILPHERAFGKCENFSNYPEKEIEAYFNTLKNPNNTDMVRLIAYNHLSCSDNPIYRDHALQVGLQDRNNELLRSQILMDVMMEKDVFIIKLIDSPSLSKESQKFYQKNKGHIQYKAYQKDVALGCVTIYIHSKCGGDRQIKISGRYVDVIFSQFLYGRFEFTADNTLEGFVISKKSKTDKIPAKLIFLSEQG